MQSLKFKFNKNQLILISNKKILIFFNSLKKDIKIHNL